MPRVWVLLDRVLLAALFVVLTRGCCERDHISKESLSTGKYVPLSAETLPPSDLAIYLDEKNNEVRFEYESASGHVIVEYELTDRHFSDGSMD